MKLQNGKNKQNNFDITVFEKAYKTGEGVLRIISSQTDSKLVTDLVEIANK